jgi:hypothetical protein
MPDEGEDATVTKRDFGLIQANFGSQLWRKLFWTGQYDVQPSYMDQII